MNRRFVAVVAAALVLMVEVIYPALGTAGRTWSQTAAEIKTEAARVTAEAELTRQEMNAERDRLMEEKRRLKDGVDRQEARLNELKDKFDRLTEAEEEKRAALADRQDEIKNLEAAIRVAAKETETLLRSSPVTPEDPARLEVFPPLRREGRFPGLEEVKGLVEVLFQEMAATGRIELRESSFIDSSGLTTQGGLLRAGGFGVYYRSGDEVGFLRLEDGGAALSALTGRPAWRDRRAIEAYFKGETEALPVDPSGGKALALLRPARPLLDRLAAGGVLIWPILAVAALALILIAERLITLGRAKTDTDRLMGRVGEMIGRGDWQEGLDLCRSWKRAPAGRVILAGLLNRDRPKETFDSALEGAILTEAPRLERFLPTLAVLAAIAPLLGLLGTVTGMIDTFQVITRFGTSDPRLMAGGISEALITTQLGLAVAMPIILIHHFLERRVDRIVADMEEKAAAVAAVRPTTQEG